MIAFFDWLRAWKRPAPVACVRGVDVSGWQDPIAWRRAYVEQGIRFCYVKASEGASHVSPGWARHARPVADEIGRLSGYHFGRVRKWASDEQAAAAGSDQAQACCEVCFRPGQPRLWVGPALDLEWESEKTGDRPSSERLAIFAASWLAEAEAATGLRSPLYLAPSYYRWRWMKGGLGLDVLRRAPTWVPKYGSQPWPDPSKAPTIGKAKTRIWQTTGKGSLPARGAAGGTVRVDCNLFLGDETELDALGRAA